ncbi:hypothetical protein AB9E06_35725, partial [Rhizobium leguminosarum]|uniref:hypothetical protein n=1 Tax=Rhizobium leguminosarum TaxID=384 RepID=UPI003F9ACF1D
GGAAILDNGGRIYTRTDAGGKKQHEGSATPEQQHLGMLPGEFRGLDQENPRPIGGRYRKNSRVRSG